MKRLRQLGRSAREGAHKKTRHWVGPLSLSFLPS
jgi:hypothetical protein